MPHCIIEYSKPLEKVIQPQQLIDAVLNGAKKSDLFELDHIKLRTQSFEHYQRGDERLSFIHVTLKILSGRTVEQRECLSQLVAEELGKLAVADVTITVEVIDMERESYTKIVR